MYNCHAEDRTRYSRLPLRILFFRILSILYTVRGVMITGVSSSLWNWPSMGVPCKSSISYTGCGFLHITFRYFKHFSGVRLLETLCKFNFRLAYSDSLSDSEADWFRFVLSRVHEPPHVENICLLDLGRGHTRGGVTVLLYAVMKSCSDNCFYT